MLISQDPLKYGSCSYSCVAHLKRGALGGAAPDPQTQGQGQKEENEREQKKGRKNTSSVWKGIGGSAALLYLCPRRSRVSG